MAALSVALKSSPGRLLLGDCCRLQQNDARFSAPPLTGGRKRTSGIVRMAGKSSHQEKPKEPEFKPSGWYEKDLPEYRAKYTTAGEGEPFEFGIDDGHHTWHEGDDGTFMDELNKAMTEAGTPTGIPGFIAVSFLPILFGLILLGVEDTYWLIFTAVWTVAYAGLQIAKGGTEVNEEPERYKMVYDAPRPVPWTQEQIESL